MRLRLVHARSAVVDLNAVRLDTLVGAVRDARAKIALHVHAWPEWLDPDERAQWGFALGEADAALGRALRAAARESARTPPLDAYWHTRDAVVRVARWCLRQGQPQSRWELAAALAFETAADELLPILRHADRAPRWLRERARRSVATRAREAFDP